MRRKRKGESASKSYERMLATLLLLLLGVQRGGSRRRRTEWATESTCITLSELGGEPGGSGSKSSANSSTQCISCGIEGRNSGKGAACRPCRKSEHCGPEGVCWPRQAGRLRTKPHANSCTCSEPCPDLERASIYTGWLC